MVSDGWNRPPIVLTSGLVLLGLWIAAKPPDEDHPYGHGRFETLTGLAIGVLLATVGRGDLPAIRWNSATMEHPPALFAVWPLLVSIAVKAFCRGVNFRAADGPAASRMKADAWNDLRGYPLRRRWR